MNDIHFVNVSKSYSPTEVLRDFSARFEPGKVYCIAGPSGVGKTTLTRLLMGLELPDSGRVERADSLRFAAVFQQDRLCEPLSAVQNAALVLEKKSGVFAADIEAALRAVGLDADAQRKPVRELSGGMRRRVCIVRALLALSDVVVLDEPFKGLDDASRAAAIAFIKRRAANKTLVLVSHDPRDAAEFGAEIIELVALDVRH